MCGLEVDDGGCFVNFLEVEGCDDGGGGLVVVVSECGVSRWSCMVLMGDVPNCL